MQRESLGSAALTVIAAIPLADIGREQRELQEAMIIGIPIVLILAGAGGLWLASVGLRPITEMAQQAARVPLNGTEDLGMPAGSAWGKSYRTCKSCIGVDFCRFGLGDSMGLARKIEKRFRGIDSPGKLKLATAGCPRNCSEALIKDVGAVAIGDGKWEIYVGGAGGSHVRKGDLLCVVDSEEWPRSSWMPRRSAPALRRCVANEWRIVCGEIPARSAALRR